MPYEIVSPNQLGECGAASLPSIFLQLLIAVCGKEMFSFSVPEFHYSYLYNFISYKGYKSRIHI